MSITATIEEGKIVLPPGTPWPSGTRVRIEAVAEGDAAAKRGKLSPEEKAHLNGAGIVPDPRYGGFWDNLKRGGTRAAARGDGNGRPSAVGVACMAPEDWEGFEESVAQNRKEQSR